MTQTEQWIFCLALVYACPSFLAGIGVTLLFVRWRDSRRAARTSPSPGAAVNKEADPLEDFNLPQLFDREQLARR